MTWASRRLQELMGKGGHRKGLQEFGGGGRGVRARKTGQPVRIRCLGQGRTAESGDLPVGTARNHPENSPCPKFSPLLA